VTNLHVCTEGVQAAGEGVGQQVGGRDEMQRTIIAKPQRVSAAHFGPKQPY